MIVGSILVAFLVAAGPLPFVIPLVQEADDFLVDGDLDGVGDIAILDGFALTVYPTANRDAQLSITLPANARAFDIVRHPSEGKMVIVAVCGSALRQFRFESSDEPDGQLLFEHNSYLADGNRPYRKVLVFEREGESLFFLPSTDAIELRTWAGELRERVEPKEVGGVRRFEMLSGHSYYPPSVGGDGSLQFTIVRGRGNEPEFVDLQWGQSSEPDLYSWSLWGDDLYNLEAPPDKWPWFALQPGVENSPRVRSAVQLNPSESHVRIDTTLSNAGTGGIGPSRKYPGMVTRLIADLPDFNGDGYTDLLLWNTDRPSVSPATIARMTLQQDWPIRLTAHVFDPKTNRYTAKPFASLSVRATWDLLLRQTYGSPLVHTVVKDLNADGRTDVGFSVDGQTYLRWMMDESGPRVETFELGEPIDTVSFDHPLDNTGRVTIGLRTKSALYVLDSK